MPKIANKAMHPPHHGVYTRLAPSQIHGVGVVAIRSIPKGTFIFFGDEDDLRWVKKASMLRLHPEIRRLFKDFCVVRNGLYGCPNNFNQLTVAWYLNHSTTPNVEADKEYQFFALRKIQKGEELTADYSTYSGGGVRGLQP